MKKIFAMAAIALFIMTSCSNDSSSSNNNNNNTDAVLLKKIVDTDEDGTYTSTFTYNGTKLNRIDNSDGSYEVYSYTDEGLGGLTYDLILSVKSYDSDNEVTEEVSYLYNTENKLAQATWLYYGGSNLEAQTIKYTHNSDNTITWEDYGATSHVIESGKIYQNKFETNAAAFDPWPAHINTSTYTYDGKNNPWKNITGYDKIYFAGTEEGLTWSQNITSEVYSNTLGVNQNYSTTTYTYNSDNYPVTSEENESGYVINTQYFYE